MDIHELQASMQAIVDGADGRSLNAEEHKRYEELEKDYLAASKTEQIRSRQEAYRTPVAAEPVTAETRTKEDGELRAAFESYLRTGQENSDLTSYTRAQSEGIPSQGGYLVPDRFMRELFWKKQKSFGGLAANVKNINPGDGREINWPTFDDTSNVGALVGENQLLPAGADLVIGAKTLTTYRWVSNGTGQAPVLIPDELIMDSEIDVVDLVMEALAERIARAQAYYWVNGTGVAQPKGIINGKTGVEIAADTDGLTYDDLITFMTSLDPAYLQNAKWAFNHNTLGMLWKMKDENGRNLWAPANEGMEKGLPQFRLLGYPVVIDQAFPDFDADANDVNWGVFGDLERAYVITRPMEIRIKRYDERYADYGQVGFSAWTRAGGTVNEDHAYIALTGEEA